MIEVLNGNLYINGVLATAIILANNQVHKGPFHLKGEDLKEEPEPVKVYGNKNVVLPGSNIVCGGNFRLGDG